MHGPYNGGVDGLIDWLRARHKGVSFAMHSVDNMLIEFSGPDAALVETYCLVAQRYTDEGMASLAQPPGGAATKRGAGMDMRAWARYVDRFERRGGEWRIAHRTVVYDSMVMHEVPEDASTLDPGCILGRRDLRDFVYQERAALGIGS